MVEQIRNFSVEQFFLWKLLIRWTEMVLRIHQFLSNFPAYLASSTLHLFSKLLGLSII